MERFGLTESDIMLVVDGATPSYQTRGADVFEGALEDGRRVKVQVRDGTIVDAFTFK